MSAVNMILTMELLSDTCFSSPASASAIVDTDIAYDSDGLPVVSGKTIRGLLRDTWLSARACIDPSSIGERLLGREKEMDFENSGALVRFGSLHLPDPVADWLLWARCRRDNPLPARALIEGLTAIRAQTSQDRATETPKTETLRSTRVLPRGLRLQGRLDLVADLDDREAELLRLLFALTRHAGLHRNRGLGHVRLKLDEAPARTYSGSQALPDVPAGLDHATVFLPVRYTLRAPLIISGASLDANSRATRDYISGAAVRGAVAAAIQKDRALQAVDRDRLISALVTGPVRYLNAYLEIEGRRSLPLPATWSRIKDARYADTAREADVRDDIAEANDDPAEQRAPVASAYHLAMGGDSVVVAAPEQQRTLHQRRVRRTGGTSSGKSTVFVYEAISPRQVFRGCVAVPTDSLAEVEPLLRRYLVGTPLYLGRSALAHYGGAPVVEIAAARRSQEILAEAAEPPREIEEGHEFLILLTSEAVLRDPFTGQHDPACVGAALERAFGGGAEAVRQAWRPARATGVNKLWRTEYPEVPSAGAGSVVVLRARRKMTREELLRIQSVPLGERVADGYGCFVVREMPPPGQLSLQAADLSTPPARPLAAPSDQRARDLLLQIQRRLYRNAVRRLVLQSANEVTMRTQTLPASSLIQRLRVPLRAEAVPGQGWRGIYRTWLRPERDGGLRDHARNALRKARIGSGTLLSLIEQASADTWAPALPQTADGTFQRCTVSESGTAEQLWQDAVRDSSAYYLDTLLARAAKASRKEPPANL